jgi:chromosome segregation ATPase
VADRREAPAAGGTGAAGDRPAELADLEAAIHAASRRLAELREMNQQLARRVGELEAQLAGRGNAETGAGPTVAGERGQAAVALDAERLEVRRRVEALARRLEQLAAAAG